MLAAYPDWPGMTAYAAWDGFEVLTDRTPQIWRLP